MTCGLYIRPHGSCRFKLRRVPETAQSLKPQIDRISKTPQSFASVKGNISFCSKTMTQIKFCRKRKKNLWSSQPWSGFNRSWNWDTGSISAKIFEPLLKLLLLLRLLRLLRLLLLLMMVSTTSSATTATATGATMASVVQRVANLGPGNKDGGRLMSF